MSISLVKESESLINNFGFYEKCYFCKVNTNYWHWRTNQPVCKECAKKRKVHELPKCSPTYKPCTKKQYLSEI